MRGRVVYEGIINKEHYLCEDYLNKGATKHYKRRRLAQIFAQYSQQYEAGQEVTQTVVERIYEQEMLQVAKDGEYCGICQFFSSS